MTIQNSHNSYVQDYLISYEVRKKELREIAKICSFWADSTESRKLKTNEETKIQSLIDSHKILTQIASCAENVFTDPSPAPIVFHKVTDQRGMPQSISCSWIDKTELTIMLLATNPANIVPFPFERVCRGAGREVVFCCIRKAIQLQIPEIQLRSLPLAKSFYTKLGFETYEKSGEKPLDKMRLTSEKIWVLYAHFISPVFAA